MYFIGIDLGGTNISVGITDETGNILKKLSTPTKADRHHSEIIKDMAGVCQTLIDDLGISQNDVKSIGIGCPGKLDPENKKAIYVNNINFRDVSFKDEFAKYFDIPIFLQNDANCAALGEYIAGACKGYKNSLTITLGTGVGGGIIIDGKIYSGSFYLGGEIGHIVIEHKGRRCTCGRSGCFEAYASASALTKRSRELASENTNSKLFKAVDGDIEKIDPKLVFELSKSGDDFCKAIVDEYIEYLAEGLTDLINIFDPEIIAIGGGISAQDDYLIKPLTKLIERDVYGGKLNAKIVKASLGNNAGIVGSAMLGK